MGSPSLKTLKELQGKRHLLSALLGMNDGMRSKPSNGSPVPEAFRGVA